MTNDYNKYRLRSWVTTVLIVITSAIGALDVLACCESYLRRGATVYGTAAGVASVFMFALVISLVLDYRYWRRRMREVRDDYEGRNRPVVGKFPTPLFKYILFGVDLGKDGKDVWMHVVCDKDGKFLRVEHDIRHSDEDMLAVLQRLAHELNVDGEAKMKGEQ